MEPTNSIPTSDFWKQKYIQLYIQSIHTESQRTEDLAQLQKANSYQTVLQSQISQAVQDVEKKCTEILKLQSDNDDLKKQCTDLQDQIKEMRRSHNEYVANLENENLFYKAERSNLTNKLYLEKKLNEVIEMENTKEEGTVKEVEKPSYTMGEED